MARNAEKYVRLETAKAILERALRGSLPSSPHRAQMERTHMAALENAAGPGFASGHRILFTVGPEDVLWARPGSTDQEIASVVGAEWDAFSAAEAGDLFREVLRKFVYTKLGPADRSPERVREWEEHLSQHRERVRQYEEMVRAILGGEDRIVQFYLERSQAGELLISPDLPPPLAASLEPKIE